MVAAEPLADLSPTQAMLFLRMVFPLREELSIEDARFVLSLKFSDYDRQRMGELSAKARAGTLNAVEQSEIDDYERVGIFLETIQSKARLRLKKAAS